MVVVVGSTVVVGDGTVVVCSGAVVVVGGGGAVVAVEEELLVVIWTVVVVGIDVEGVMLDEVDGVEVVVVAAGMVTVVVPDPAAGSALSTNGVGNMKEATGTRVPSIAVVVMMSAESPASSRVRVLPRTSG